VYAGSPEQEVWTEQFVKNRTIHIANFSSSGTVPIRVTTTKSFKSVQISPKSRGYTYTQDGSSITFTINKPEKLMLFFTGDDGKEFDPLYLIANPLEVDPPTATTPGVRYYGPGKYDVGALAPKSGETIYIAGGALVNGSINVDGVSDVKVLGRGILQESGGDGYTIRVANGQNWLVEGIIVRDIEPGWSTRWDHTQNVTLHHMKVFSFGVNEDGIDPCSSSDMTIDDVLISAGDDNIAIKSLDGGEVSNIQIMNSVFDSYPGGGGGDGIKIGTETDGDIHGVTVKNCDVVRDYGENSYGGHSAFSVVHRLGGKVHDLVYEDIRVESKIQHKNFELQITSTAGGSIDNVLLKDNQWESADHPINLLALSNSINNVTFDNCTVAGKKLAAPADITVQGTVTGVKFQ
jgi:polygalacturonase